MFLFFGSWLSKITFWWNSSPLNKVIFMTAFFLLTFSIPWSFLQAPFFLLSIQYTLYCFSLFNLMHHLSSSRLVKTPASFLRWKTSITQSHPFAWPKHALTQYFIFQARYLVVDRVSSARSCYCYCSLFIILVFVRCSCTQYPNPWSSCLSKK